MENIEQLKNHALGLMKASGFSITEKIEIAVDEKLQIMGYTTEESGKEKIVVAQWALQSDMLIGLLIHELSHIYRNQTRHPSHNFAIHNKAVAMVFGHRKLQKYQEEILRSIINTIQDLYADDIFFRVKKDIKTNPADFFIGWVKEPVEGRSEKSKWTTAGNMISAAFAQANLERHHAKDTNGEVEKAVKDFLSQSDPRIAEKYEYFKNVMVQMPEKITNEEFGALLIDFLRNFFNLTK